MASARFIVVVSLVILGVTPALAQTPSGGSGASATQPAPTSFLAPARATWDSTRTLVVGLIEAMPEDKWDFKPTPAVRGFREVVAHLIGENGNIVARFAEGEEPTLLPAPLLRAPGALSARGATRGKLRFGM